MVVQSKSMINAKIIMDDLYTQDPYRGGHTVLVSGAMGSAKTAVCLGFCDTQMQKYPNTPIFFSNSFRSPMQFQKLPYGKWTLLIQEDAHIRILDRNNRMQQIHPREVITFTDYDDLLQKSKKGKVNGVFFKEPSLPYRYTWIDFITYLRGLGSWSYLCFDEFSDVAPGFSSGKVWHSIGDFSIVIKELRKDFINLIANTQTVADIDPRVASKMMVRIFLPGARITRACRITQKAIDGLRRSPTRGVQAWIESTGIFGKVLFSKIYNPNPNYNWSVSL